MADRRQRVRASNIRKGHRLLCPADGEVERVESVEGNRNGTRLIRTERHEHFRDIDEVLIRVVSR